MPRSSRVMSATVLAVGLCALVAGLLQAQGSRPEKNTETAAHSISYVSIETKAKAAKDNSAATVRAFVDEVFAHSLLAKAAPSIKERVYRSELAFRNGRHSPVAEDTLVAAANERVRASALPQHMRWTKQQLRMNREATRFFVRHFANTDPTKGTVSDDMSPLEAAFATIDLGTQKLLNPEFHVPPEQWEKTAAARRAKANARAAEHSPVHQAQPLFKATPKIVKSLPLIRIPDVADESGFAVMEVHSFLDSIGVQR